MMKHLLIVDAYNMIGNWPQLAQLKKQDRLADARDLLLKMVSQYQKVRDIPVTVVFDAMYVPGSAKKYQDFNLEVIWTAQDQTADSYIEALVKQRRSPLLQISVASSDQAEQWTVFEDALRIPAPEMLADIQNSEAEVQHDVSHLADQKMVRQSPFDDEELSRLASLRDRLSDDHSDQNK